jgi:hypothetical protein
MDTRFHEPIPLRAGPLSLVFDRGELRWIRIGDREVLRGIYAAVRPPDWATVPAELEGLHLEEGAGGFRLRFQARHRQGPLWLEWEGRVDGSADGTVRYEMDGVARSTFRRNRIGLCVLHSVKECAGQSCTVEKTDGTILRGAFPKLVSPHQPFLEIAAMRHPVTPGIEAEVRYEGEVFEMEDQRNWSDASFKTYSTPLSLPLPVEVLEGERLRQVVTLSVRGAEEEPAPATAVGGGWLSEAPLGVTVDRGRSWAMPQLGLGLGAAPVPAESLRALPELAPAHLRVDIRPSEPGWREALAAAAKAAREGATRLEVAAFVSADGAAAELGELAEAVESVNAPVEAWLLFDAASGVSAPDRTARVRKTLLSRSSADTAPVLLGGGTDVYFAELNRGRDAAEGLDLVSLAINPQVHASDDATLVENTTSLGWIAETIREFVPNAPLALSPVTLRTRPDGDPRQRTSFAAGWMLGFVAAAAEAGFARLTLFELEGSAGVMDAGRLFPVGRVLADLGELTRSSAAARVVAVRPEDPWRCLALAVEAGRTRRVYLFNPTPRTQDLVVAGLPTEAQVRRLEMGIPETGFTPAGPAATTEDGHAVRLDAREVAVLDVELESR